MTNDHKGGIPSGVYVFEMVKGHDVSTCTDQQITWQHTEQRSHKQRNKYLFFKKRPAI